MKLDLEKEEQDKEKGGQSTPAVGQCKSLRPCSGQEQGWGGRAWSCQRTDRRVTGKDVGRSIRDSGGWERRGKGEEGHTELRNPGGT